MRTDVAFLQKTRQGRVRKVQREHYLRTDIYCGSPLAEPEHRGPDLEACTLSGSADTYLVIDTNVALHQVSERAPRRASQRARERSARAT